MRHQAKLQVSLKTEKLYNCHVLIKSTLIPFFFSQFMVWWWLLPCWWGFGKNVQWFIPRLRLLITLFRPGSVHSGSVSRDDCGLAFADELSVNSFPHSFPLCAWTVAKSALSDFIGSRVYVCVGVTCHLHFWQNDWGLLRSTAVTWGWNGHRVIYGLLC